MAGIYGNQPSEALPVVINSNGQLGTTTQQGGVTSWNGRTGAVVPQTGDYSFFLVSGTLASSQLSGAYSNALTFSNTSNAFTGNGSGLTGVLPAGGSPHYIQSGTTMQGGANFNISGGGSANVLNSATVYQIGGISVLSTPNPSNLFVGQGAGYQNSPVSGHNTFVGLNAGNANFTGHENTFFGDQADLSNIGGSFNTYSGFEAGEGNLTGSFNTISGSLAGANAGGSYNTFTGSSAGFNNTNSYNTFTGYFAGYSNTTGSDNTFTGASAGGHNTSGTITPLKAT